MKKLKILIVDDDPKLSALMATILKKTGLYEVLEENRPYRAFFTARAFSPDLILMDIDMPGKSGGDIAAELANDPSMRKIPVIFVTSLVSKGDLGGEFGTLGRRLYIAKPVNFRILIETVHSVLEYSFSSEENIAVCHL